MKINQRQRIVINPEQIINNQVIFTSAQEHYLKRVLRLKNGAEIIVMDGQQNSWLVQLTNQGNSIIAPWQQMTELPINITLICALPKSNKFEDIIRLSTELGVTNILPVISERTLLNPSLNKLERWRKIAQESAEQSERQIVPYLGEPIDFKQVFQQINLEESNKYICVARGKNPHLLSCLSSSFSNHIILMTGPEGGWTQGEISKANEYNFLSVSLGKRILTAITAPLTAIALSASYYEIDTPRATLR